jgi:hypothetical protein
MSMTVRQAIIKKGMTLTAREICLVALLKITPSCVYPLHYLNMHVDKEYPSRGRKFQIKKDEVLEFLNLETTIHLRGQ